MRLDNSIELADIDEHSIEDDMSAEGGAKQTARIFIFSPGQKEEEKKERKPIVNPTSF